LAPAKLNRRFKISAYNRRHYQIPSLLFAAGKNPRGIDNAVGTEILAGGLSNHACGIPAGIPDVA
jgi:hypothetical protein